MTAQPRLCDDHRPVVGALARQCPQCRALNDADPITRAVMDALDEAPDGADLEAIAVQAVRDAVGYVPTGRKWSVA